MTVIGRIDHVAIAITDWEAATHFWSTLLGLPVEKIVRVESEGVDAAFLRVGESHIELIRPIVHNSVARFIEKRGAGIHHLCLEVDDLDGLLAKLDSADSPLQHTPPQQTPQGRQYCFILPASTGGVLLELYQK